MFLLFYVILCIKLVDNALGMPAGETPKSAYNFVFQTRQNWQAREPPVDRQVLSTPVPYVVIHHSYSPGACSTPAECQQAMRSMQNFHMDTRKWWDIGYNFAVGGDGAAYEGRGWQVLGAHALHFNNVSLGICLVGDWTTQLPPKAQLNTAKALIEAGVKLGYISPTYKLIGHRQVRETECPGQALFDEIQQWPRYSRHPASAKDIQQLTN